MLDDGFAISGLDDDAESDLASVNGLLAGLESDSEAGDPSRKNLLAELQDSDDEDKPAELQESPGKNLLAQLEDSEDEQDDHDDDNDGDDAFLAGLDSDGDTGNQDCTEVNDVRPPSSQALRQSNDTLPAAASIGFTAPPAPGTCSSRSSNPLACVATGSLVLHEPHRKHDSTIFKDSEDGESQVKAQQQQQPSEEPAVAMPDHAPFEDSLPTHSSSIRPPSAPAGASSRSKSALTGTDCDGIRPPSKTAVVSSRLRSDSVVSLDFHSKHNSTIGCVTASVIESDDEIGVLQDMQDISDLEAFGRLAHRSTTLNLQDLHLSSLEPLCLQSLTSLKTLVLSGNEFADAHVLAHSLGHLRALTELDISRCHLKELPVLEHLQQLRRIDASGNALKTSRGILYCSDLRQVLLSHNQLRRVEQLETLNHLEELDVSHNRLGPTTLAAMRAVAACSRLRVLLVAGNPFSSTRAHHVQLTDLIPSLELIDGRRVQTLRCRSGCRTPNRGSSPNRTRMKATRCQSKLPGRRSNVENRSPSDTSISYSLLAHNSPARVTAQCKTPQYFNLTQSFSSHLGSRDLVNSCQNSPAPSSKRGSKAMTQCNLSGTVARSLGGPSLSMPSLEAGMDKSSQGLELSHCGQMSTGFDRGQHSMERRQAVWADTSMSTPSKVEASVDRRGSINQARSDAENDPIAKDKASQWKQNILQPSSATTAEPCTAVADENDNWRVTAARHEKAKPSLALQELLEAKHRLLRKVTAQLSGTPQHVGSTVPAPTLYDSPTKLATSRIQTVPLADGTLQAAPVAMKAGSDLTTLRATVRTESLRTSLRDGIERKRALLDQLRRI